MTSAELLSGSEICSRKGFWRDWQRNRLSTSSALSQTLNRVLVAPKSQEEAFGDMAGSIMLEIASSPGIETSYPEKYDCAMHHACLADIIATVLRKPDSKPWISPNSDQNWTTGAMLSPEGDKLRRLVLVSHWNEDRHYSECHSWATVGEMAHYKLPMDLVVLIIGQERNGKRKSHWTSALRHTIGKTHIRFRRRVGNTSGGFKDSWTEIWREDHDEISRETWLNAMLKDDVMRDCVLTVQMPAMTNAQAQFYRDLAHRKLSQIQKLKVKPSLQLTGCHWPVKCQFLRCCHEFPEREPSERMGFVRISPHTQVPQANTHTVEEIPAGPILPDLKSVVDPLVTHS